MIPLALGFLRWGKMVAQAVFDWLSKRSLAEIGCIVLLILCLIEFSALKLEQRHSAKVERQLRNCAEVQKRIVEQSRAQQKQVGKVIDHYITVDRPVIRKEVQRIESAPIEPGCKTVKAVLDADI